MRIFIPILFLLLPLLLSGQDSHSLKPCGTQAYKSEWLKQYQKNKDKYPKTVEGEIFVPLNVAIVGRDNGAGLFSETTMLQSFCTLVNDFSETEIIFYLQNYRNILDSEFFEHETVLAGAEKMFEYDTDDAINCYFVGNPAGNCGYNLPYASIAISLSCADPDEHTWAHELGHQFSLPHPFLGWEGGVGHSGEIEYNYSDDAPEIVLYDYTFFQDTLILDTLIIDTAFVEYVDGSNCDVAGDGFCDTPPDYLGQIWPCTSDATSFQTQKDPSGTEFKSDGSLIMSYAADACSSRFTEEQVLAMRASIEEEDSDILTEATSSTGAIDGNGGIELYTPQDAGLDFEDIYFDWSEVTHADYYLFQVFFGTAVLYDTLVTSPGAWLDEMNPALPLKWTVTPFNSSDFCNPVSGELLDIEPTDVSSIENEINEVEVTLVPNIINSHSELRIQSPTIFENYSVYSFDGRKQFAGRLGNDKIPIPQSLSSGVYFIRLMKDNNYITKKFIKQ